MFWTWHICVPHQAIFAIVCRDCALTEANLEEKKIKKLEGIAVREFQRIEEGERIVNERLEEEERIENERLEEEERIENERLQEERIERERREAEDAARSLISISRIPELEREFPLIVSLLRAPSKVNGRKQ